jgi:hypothetical protein
LGKKRKRWIVRRKVGEKEEALDCEEESWGKRGSAGLGGGRVVGLEEELEWEEEGLGVERKLCQWEME